MTLTDKLKEILGSLSGYKQKYEQVHLELQKKNEEHKQAHIIADNIINILKGWEGPWSH